MKIYSYVAIICFVCLSLIPPVDFVIQNPQNEYWLWMVLIAGFAGIFTIFIETNWLVRAVAIGGLFNCFFSAVPFVSFTSYVSLVACCYFFILCTKIEDWDIVMKAGQTVVLLNLFIMTMQFFDKDPLLNFGLFHVEHFGTIGQHMQASSFYIVISSLLLTFSKFNILLPFVVSLFCHSCWSFLSAGVGVAVYSLQRNLKFMSIILLSFCFIFAAWAVKDGKILENLDSKTGRFAVWERSIELANEKPLTGWGIGTYKDLFSPLSGFTCTPWRTAHNFFVQLLFEVGYPMTICLLFALAWLLVTLYKANLWLILAGASMIVSDSFVHFPDRMIQTVPIIVLFLAYCQFNLRRYS